MNAASTRRYAIVVVLSTLLVTSGIAAGVGVDLGDDDARDGTPRFSVAECCLSQFDTAGARNHSQSVGPSAGAALTLRNDRLDDRLGALAARRQLETADDETVALDSEFATLRAATDQLAADQDAVLRAYSVRNVTAEQLLVELVRIDAAAGRLNDRRGVAVSRLEDLTVVDIDIRALRVDLLSLQGPVRHHSLGRLTGHTARGVVEVQASTDYVALATTTDRQSVVERYQADYRERSSEEPATIEAAADLVAAYYPVEWDNRTGYTIRQLDATLLYVELEHTEGTVVAYIDRPTAQVFKEFQYTALSAASVRHEDEGNESGQSGTER